MLVNLLDGIKERHIFFVGPLLQLAKGFGANFAIRYIDNSSEAQFIMRISQQAQIGQHILNFFAFIELAAANDLIGNIGSHKLLFQGA